MPTAPINGIELFYEDSDAENTDGKPVVFFMHGAGGNEAYGTSRPPWSDWCAPWPCRSVTTRSA